MRDFENSGVQRGNFNPDSSTMSGTGFKREHAKTVEDTLGKLGSNISSELRNMEAVNMNAGYLLSIIGLMEEYKLVKIHGYNGSRTNLDYFDNLRNILDTIYDFLYPKVTKEERVLYDEQFKKIDEDIDNMFQQTAKGIYADKQKMRECMNKIKTLFRALECSMNEIGMLTKKEASPLDAMSEMD
jgi:hypothetical protein